MEQLNGQHSATRRSPLRKLGGVAGVVLAVAVPMLAATLAWGRPAINQERPHITAQDETLTAGRQGGARATTQTSGASTSGETVLQEWTYTRRPKPSGGG